MTETSAGTCRLAVCKATTTPMATESLPLDAAVIATLQGVTTATLTTVLLKKGLRNVWIRGTRPLAPGYPRLVGRAVHRNVVLLILGRLCDRGLCFDASGTGVA